MRIVVSFYSALSFGIGGKGSGVQWHVHGPGFSSESIYGSKHDWVLYPPDQKPTYDEPDYTSRHWMEEVYTSLHKSDHSLLFGHDPV